jgi:PLD-like domain
MSPSKRSRRGRSDVSSNIPATRKQKAGNRFQPPKPLEIFSGTIEHSGDATVLSAAGMKLELLVDEDVPISQAAIRKARLRTARRLRSSVNRSITLQGRQEGTFIVAVVPIEPLRASSAVSLGADPKFQKVQKAIAQHGAQLRAVPGVITVRPGYEFRNGWITDRPCIVVTVRKKMETALLPRQARLPSSIGGVPVDVEPATPTQQILANQLSAQAATIAADSSLPASEGSPRAEVFTAELIRQSKYVPPPGVKLDPVQGPINVLCHASPDAGWPKLNAFLQGTKQRLTVAMYDFTAPHILTGVKSALASAKAATLRLILDPSVALSAGNDPINPKANDFPEDKVEQDLTTVLGKRFSFEWAAVSHQGKTTGGIFPTAYHIKVAVRDGKSFWLSSGNWQSSNQPNLDPLGPDKSLPGLQTTYNREWHVIVDHPALATMYEKFINWDFSQAQPFQLVAKRMRPDLLVPQELFAAAVVAPQFFAPKQFTVQAAEQVQPLLTPDNYSRLILPVIQAAKKTLYFQNQYINIGKQNSNEFAALVNALRQKIKEGIDVRIILRDIGNTRQMLETLKQNLFDMTKVRVQKACHNKGIIVDSKVVVVGSHNWSSDGTTYNRDASLIFSSTAIARYYETIFLYDWNNLAHQSVSAEKLMPQIAEAGAVTPEGSVRVPWDAYLGDDDQSEDADALDAALAANVVRVSSVQVTEPQVRQLAGSPGERVQAFAAHSASNIQDLNAAKVECSGRYLLPDGYALRKFSVRGVTAAPHHNVVGVGVGEKISDGKSTGILCVKCFVQLKYAESDISPQHLLPKTVAGLPVDVEPVGILRPFATMPNPRVQWRPSQPGCSIGFRYPTDSSNRMAGTFGALVADAKGNKYILSNNHVLADEGRLKKGAPIFQAGILDLDQDALPNQIAKLSRWVPLGQGSLKVDCALAQPLLIDLVSKQILQIGAPLGVAQANIDMLVHKFGRTTGYTAGRVTSVNTDVVIEYETGTYTFGEQIMIVSLDDNSFSMPGDSGALVLQRGPAQLAVGLLFAGSSSHSTANHIGDVLQALQVNLA